MRPVLKVLGLLLLLTMAQQGAVVHELSHVFGSGNAETKIDAAGADSTCALCPAFAQATTPAFSHSFHVPVFFRAATERSTILRIAAIDAAVPRARSRGPPV
jgi:hypothetical protein